MYALYAFMRATDDLADEAGEIEAKRAELARWRAALIAALAGTYSHHLHAALHHTVRTFGVDPRHLFAVIDGVEADLTPVRFETFADLYPYCYRVASAVGLACIPIWGTTTSGAEKPAEAAGIAFQLTNILRDLSEDLARGRVYLPQDELTRFSCPPEAWHDRGQAFRELMRFQADRAWQFYRESESLTAFLTPPGRAIFGMMAGTYRALLNAIEGRGFDVFSRRVRVSRWRKAGILLQAWPVRWGWV
jgi:phytoene synthase